LLYNTFGLSLAVLFFERDYQTAPAPSHTGEQQLLKVHLPSLPYSGDIEISDEIQGLVRHQNEFYNPVHVLHTNDTLYITLQSNQAARDRFFELTGAMQMLSDPQADVPESSQSKALKLLSGLFKLYVPAGQHHFQIATELFGREQIQNSSIFASYYSCSDISVNSPPPEASC
jgi:hypothetical protein